MLIAEEFLLLCLNETSGRKSISGEKIDPALGGAVLVELALLERISISDDGQGWSKRRRLSIASMKPTDDDVSTTPCGTSSPGRAGRSRT